MRLDACCGAPQVRFVFRCINLVCTFLMTSPYRCSTTLLGV